MSVPPACPVPLPPLSPAAVAALAAARRDSLAARPGLQRDRIRRLRRNGGSGVPIVESQAAAVKRWYAAASRAMRVTPSSPSDRPVHEVYYEAYSEAADLCLLTELRAICAEAAGSYAAAWLLNPRRPFGRSGSTI